MKIDEIISILNLKFGESKFKADFNCTPHAIGVNKNDIVQVCLELQQNPSLYFDMLSCLTAIDNGVEAKTMEVVYNLYSIPYNIHLMLKVVLPRENAEVDTVTHIWKTANWNEREAFDMYGINFIGHPDLRRILMPADWEGYPLRKDYKHQEYYRDIKVEY
ncbi:MAG TPA: NADH-quinone oxidoreductase subunit C [Cyclobacteriaceae bacterium]|jgi:NADH-quinone oxidoreductase subunit C|nr:NADH-quinone oxidoreductase subunit C [Cyclobacteriaceae bacterium]